MIFDSFSSLTLQSGMDAMWAKMEVHSDNIANYETPGYKAKKVSFSQVLERVNETGEQRPVLKTKITADESTQARIDGNNVSMEKEQLELWKVQAQYAFAVQKINEEYANVRTILTQVGK